MSDTDSIQLYIGDNIDAVLTEMREQVRRQGALMSGTTQQGTLSAALPIGGTLSGSYQAIGKSLKIVINQRPDFLSLGTIESKMQDFVLDAQAVVKSRSKSARPGTAIEE